MDLIMLALRISVGLTVIFGVRIATTYFFGDVEKGGKSNEFKRLGR
jgi:hypothetical protein